jgi:nucleotide-binding universal stress UspA family protein
MGEVIVYEHILISSDGSDLAQAGVEHGLSLAKLHGSKVTAVTVTEPLGGQFAFASELWSPNQDEIAVYDKAQAAIAGRILGRIRQSAEMIGVPIDTVHVSWRLPASALVETAEQRGCSLIVMASHGRTGVSQVMLGSQTARAVSTSKVPVLVVR